MSTEGSDSVPVSPWLTALWSALFSEYSLVGIATLVIMRGAFRSSGASQTLALASTEERLDSKAIVLRIASEAAQINALANPEESLESKKHHRNESKNTPLSDDELVAIWAKGKKTTNINNNTKKRNKNNGKNNTTRRNMRSRTKKTMSGSSNNSSSQIKTPTKQAAVKAEEVVAKVEDAVSKVEDRDRKILSESNDFVPSDLILDVLVADNFSLVKKRNRRMKEAAEADKDAAPVKKKRVSEANKEADTARSLKMMSPKTTSTELGDGPIKTVSETVGEAPAKVATKTAAQAPAKATNKKRNKKRVSKASKEADTSAKTTGTELGAAPTKTFSETVAEAPAKGAAKAAAQASAKTADKKRVSKANKEAAKSPKITNPKTSGATFSKIVAKAPANIPSSQIKTPAKQAAGKAEKVVAKVEDAVSKMEDCDRKIHPESNDFVPSDLILDVLVADNFSLVKKRNRRKKEAAEADKDAAPVNKKRVSEANKEADTARSLKMMSPKTTSTELGDGPTKTVSETVGEAPAKVANKTAAQAPAKATNKKRNKKRVSKANKEADTSTKTTGTELGAAPAKTFSEIVAKSPAKVATKEQVDKINESAAPPARAKANSLVAAEETLNTSTAQLQGGATSPSSEGKDVSVALDETIADTSDGFETVLGKRAQKRLRRAKRALEAANAAMDLSKTASTGPIDAAAAAAAAAKSEDPITTAASNEVVAARVLAPMALSEVRPKSEATSTRSTSPEDENSGAKVNEAEAFLTSDGFEVVVVRKAHKAQKRAGRAGRVSEAAAVRI